MGIVIRHRWLLLAVVAGALLAAHAFWSMRLKPGITWRAFQRVREGMTRQQVEAILGEPAEFDIDNPDGPEAPEAECQFWIGEHLLISVTFDEDERVVRKSFCTIRDTDPSGPFERLCQWFGL
jgi:hypothetical protein